VSSALAQQNWRWANSLPASSQWKDVAFGNGLYVAVGVDATIATSPDGTTWTVRRMSTAFSTLNGIEFANGLFVAVGMGSPARAGGALIMTGTDGANWSVVDSVADTVNAQLLDVAHGGGTWVAVGFGGTKVLSSTDGRTWTQRATPGSAIPAKVAYGAGRFVASGSGNTALTSTDGITWTNPTVAAATNTQLQGVAFGSGVFVLVGRDSTFNAAAFTSTDGTTWTPANAIAGSNGTGFIAVGASSTGFVAAGGNLIYSSPDGAFWTARTSALPISGRQLGPLTEGVSSATFAGTRFFVLGLYGSITASPDGSAWTRRSSGTVSDLGAVLHDGTRFVASGSGGTILTGTDGSSWTQLTTGSTADFNVLAHSGTRYVAAGFNGIHHSANLTAWTAVAGTTFDRWTAAAYGGGRFIVANSATTLGTRSSADGVTWSPAVGISGAGGNTNGLVFGNGIFVLTMTGFGSTPSKLYTSADGTGWTPRAADLLPLGTSVTSIRFGVGRFVALTGNQRSLTSTDGITWTSNPLPSPAFSGSVRFLGDRFYASARVYGAPSYSSTDGATWTLVADSFGPNLLLNDSGGYPFMASNGSAVVAVGPNGMILRGDIPAPPNPADISRLSNLSVRTTLAANQILTVGFTMSGGAKNLLVRAAGPALGALGVPGTMADPKLALFNGSTQIAANDNWLGNAAVTSAAASVGAFPFATAASLDAALVASVDGGRTVQVSGPAAGNLIVEAYDAGAGNSPRLTNLSALNQVGTGADVLIAGFTIAGLTNKNILIRAVGPGLAVAPFNIGGTLADPKLEIFNSAQTKIDQNDTWSSTLVATFSSVGAFALPAGSKDAALIVSLPPGGYTVQVSGADGGTGLAIIELYELP